ncbi:MAG: TolC family protein [Candidatus Muiribacteriaceae bacterium]
MIKYCFLIIFLIIAITAYSTQDVKTIDINEFYDLVLKEGSAVKLAEAELLTYLADVYDKRSEFNPVWSFYANLTEENRPLISSQRTGFTGEEMNVDGAGYGLNYSQKLRNGIDVSAGLSYQRQYQNTLPSESKKSETEFTFTMDIPLASGSGHEVIFRKQISELMHEAAILDFRHRVSGIVLNALIDYCRTGNSEKKMHVSERSYHAMQNIKEDTKKLIDANQIPAAEMNKVDAALYRKKAEKAYAETEFFENRHELIDKMGMMFDSYYNIEFEEYVFKTHEISGFSKEKMYEYISGAVSGREDIEASEKRVDAAVKYYEYVSDLMKDDIFIQADSDIKGLSEGDEAESLTGAWSDNRTDLSWSLTLMNQFAGGSAAKKAEMIRACSQKKLAQIAYDNKVRSVEKEVAVAYRSMINAWITLKASESSKDFSKESLQAENKKYNLGLSTILDVLEVEDIYNQSEITFMDNHTQFVSAYLYLLHVRGVLLHKDKDGGFILELSEHFK